MKKILVYIFSIFCYSGFSQQNLVLNPSCEDYSSCPNALTQINLLYNIASPSINTPDFFHVCYTNPNNNASVPSNFCGYQSPMTGDAYVGIGMIFNGTNNREYVTFLLSDSLIEDKLYQISLYVSCADSFKYSTDKIGAYLHNNSFFQNDFYYLAFQPQIENSVGNFVNDKVNWMKIEEIFIASGGEKFITIGNFYPDSLTDTISFNNDPVSSSNKGGAYYFIDDVSVTEIIDTTDTIQPIDTTIYVISVFPNPNNGEFSLHYNLNTPDCHQGDCGVFKIYNAIGQMVFEEKLLQNNGVRNLQLDLAAGVYVWEVESLDEILKRKKMIIYK